MENKPAFILLAGGKSERMGVAKGLLKHQQTFWILEQLNRISNTSISAIYIGLGHQYQHYFNAIPWFEKAIENPIEFQGLNVKIVINENPDLGSFSTLQTVLKKINTTTDIIVNPIDVPLLNSTELQKIIETKNDIVIPTFKGKNGHPIKINFAFWKQLIDLDIEDKNTRLDIQLKKVKPTNISEIEVSDKLVLYNLNTKTAWISFLKETLI